MRLPLRSCLALAVSFAVLSFLVVEVVLSDVSAGHSLVAVYAGVGALSLIMMSGGHWPNVFGCDMFDHYYGRRPNPVRPDPEVGSTNKSHRTFASSAGGHVARSVGHLQQLVGHGAGRRQRLILG